jgi:hypothetical protein
MGKTAWACRKRRQPCEGWGGRYLQTFTSFRTMKQMDNITRRAVKLLQNDYPEFLEAENPAEKLYKLASEKTLYARLKASGTATKQQRASSKK